VSPWTDNCCEFKYHESCVYKLNPTSLLRANKKYSKFEFVECHIAFLPQICVPHLVCLGDQEHPCHHPAITRTCPESSRCLVDSCQCRAPPCLRQRRKWSFRQKVLRPLSPVKWGGGCCTVKTSVSHMTSCSAWAADLFAYCCYVRAIQGVFCLRVNLYDGQRIFIMACNEIYKWKSW